MYTKTVYRYPSCQLKLIGRLGEDGDARMKVSLTLVQKIIQLTSTHNNSLRTLWVRLNSIELKGTL